MEVQARRHSHYETCPRTVRWITFVTLKFSYILLQNSSVELYPSKLIPPGKNTILLMTKNGKMQVLRRTQRSAFFHFRFCDNQFLVYFLHTQVNNNTQVLRKVSLSCNCCKNDSGGGLKSLSSSYPKMHDDLLLLIYTKVGFIVMLEFKLRKTYSFKQGNRLAITALNYGICQCRRTFQVPNALDSPGLRAENTGNTLQH